MCRPPLAQRALRVRRVCSGTPARERPSLVRCGAGWGGVGVLSLDPVGAFQFQGPWGLVDAAELLLGGGGEPEGVLDEADHVAAVVVPQGAERTRHRGCAAMGRSAPASRTHSRSPG